MGAPRSWGSGSQNQVGERIGFGIEQLSEAGSERAVEGRGAWQTVGVKAVLASIQGGVVTAQAACFLARHRSCDLCGSLLLSKGPGRTRFRTAFGTIALPSPRFHSCRCQPKAAKTFRVCL